MSKQLLKQLKEERTTYSEMIEFCCDSMVLNNCIIEELQNNGFYFDLFCGDDTLYYNKEYKQITRQEYEQLEENGEEIHTEYADIYQWFIIDYSDAERLAKYTNEIVYCCEQLDLCLLGVTHCGTSWDYVPSNWKELEELEEN